MSGAMSVVSAEDVAGSKDYPLIQRFPGTTLVSYNNEDFNFHEFAIGTDTPQRVEGRHVALVYTRDDAAHPLTPLQVVRNYQAAFKKGGWTEVFADDTRVVAKLAKNGQEIWAGIAFSNSGAGEVEMEIIEKGEMV